MGAKIYAQSCASCHGDHLEGKGVGGDKLIGGRDTLATKIPTKTVEGYWPYATDTFRLREAGDAVQCERIAKRRRL
ncbi:c-type cytochrome [Bradyrhizobium murdochi]|uniref:c-type cytochrome n=1 Tax=Bradyrhizobium murdochi TaxID=1038859 RepID=UPI00040B66D8|nr:c-type cytochrome [Bradyrhizobium murdochi]